MAFPARPSTGRRQRALLARRWVLCASALLAAGRWGCASPSEPRDDLAAAPSTVAQGSTTHRPGLGVGTNYAETKSFRRCVTLPSAPSHPAFSSRLYDERSVSTRSDLNEAMGIDASVSARGMWGKAGGEASYFKGVKMTSSAFYWLVNADYRLSDESIDMGDPAFSLTAEAKRILAGPDGIANFRRSCGQFFYSSMKLGGRYALLYEFKSEDTSVVERLRAKATYTGFGVDASAEFQKTLEMATRASILTVHFATAGGGTGELEKYATNPAELRAHLAQLQSDLYNEHKGVGVEYVMSDYEMFAEVQEAIAASKVPEPELPTLIERQLADDTLRRLYSRACANIDASGRIEVLLKQASGPEPLCRVSPERTARLLTLQATIAENNHLVADKARECLNLPASCRVDETLVRDPWSREDLEDALIPDADYMTLRGWTVWLEPRSPGSMFLHFVGEPPGEPGQRVVFETDHSIYSIGPQVVGHAENAEEHAVYIGSTALVIDPHDGQPRADVCVYASAHACTLRIAPVGPRTAADDERNVKLQIVYFDHRGFVSAKRDCPPLAQGVYR